MSRPSPTVDQMRAIRRDYAERQEDGSYRYELPAVAERNRVSVSMVSKVARQWGLRRYLCRGAA